MSTRASTRLLAWGTTREPDIVSSYARRRQPTRQPYDVTAGEFEDGRPGHGELFVQGTEIEYRSSGTKR